MRQRKLLSKQRRSIQKSPAAQQGFFAARVSVILVAEHLLVACTGVARTLPTDLSHSGTRPCPFGKRVKHDPPTPGLPVHVSMDGTERAAEVDAELRWDWSEVVFLQ